MKLAWIVAVSTLPWTGAARAQAPDAAPLAPGEGGSREGAATSDQAVPEVEAEAAVVDGPTGEGEEGESSDSATLNEREPSVLSVCIADHEKAQLARLSGGFLESARHLKECAAPECPEALRRDCITWRGELEALVPTVVVAAEDDNGDLVDARIVIDGLVSRTALDGRPISLDPGKHVIRVELAGGRSKEQRIVLGEGEKGRKLAFDFRSPLVETAPSGAPPTKTVRPIPSGVYLLGATAFVGLGVAVGFGADAGAKAKTARDLCAPLCDPDVARAVRQRAAVADIALGVAVASAIGAVVVYSYRPERVVPLAEVGLNVHPGPEGGIVTLGGAF